MIKKSVADSSHFVNLMNERLKRKSIERFRSSSIFADPHYIKELDDKEKIDKAAEELYNNKRRSLWTKGETSLFDVSCFPEDSQYKIKNSDNSKREYIRKVYEEKEISNRQETFIKSRSAKIQKQFREFYSEVVLGDEENKRKEMISNIKNQREIPNTKYEERLRQFRQKYPAYSNIFNDENLLIHNELESYDCSHFKSRLADKKSIDDDSVAKLLSHNPPFQKNDITTNHRNTLNKDTNDNIELITELLSCLTPTQRNLSSKLHGSEFYYKVINNPGTVFFVKFKLRNTSSEHNEKFIQDIATSCGTFAFQIDIDLDPVIWSPRGSVTGKLRFSDKGLEKFKEELKKFGIGIETIGEIQEEKVKLIK